MTKKTSTNKLIEQLANDAKPVKLTVSPIKQTMLCYAITFISYSLVIAITGVRIDLSEQLQTPLFVAELLFSIITSLTGILAACHLAYPDCYGRPFVKYIVFLPLTILIGIIGIQIDPQGNITSEVAEHLTLKPKPECTIEIILLTLVPAIILFNMIKRIAPVHYYLAALSATIGTVSIGYFTQRLIEVTNDLLHIMVWHVAPMTIVILIGLFFGRVVLRW